MGIPTAVAGLYGPADKLRTFIAYSAIDEGGDTIQEQLAERPYGDTAIDALFDDANDLGLAGFLGGGVERRHGRDAIDRLARPYAGTGCVRDSPILFTGWCVA
jgi:hypothetical protein